MSESYTCSARAKEAASQWLDNCVSNHEECSQTMLSDFLPTRLIDIGTEGSIVPRLVNSTSFKSPQRYITLSHCWGGQVPMTLRQDNLARMAQGIDYQCLPKTFRHALVVTRQLKCRYIWIDSLCIIQDSHEDWEKEASQMNQVYANAYCNLSASAAKNSSEGMFFHRHVLAIFPLRITLNKIQYYFQPSHANIYSIVNDSTLNSRAWVYQERFLSPRILHFTPSQLFWECKTQMACESYPMSCSQGDFMLPPLKRVNPALDGLLIRQRDGGSIFNQSPSPFVDAFAVWKEVIYNYSRRQLTRNSDKLVAISGVAHEMNKILDDDYLAGIWRRHLRYGLIWQILDEKSTRSSAYIAPSWSWASTNGVVARKPLAEVEYEHAVEILRAEVVLAGPNRFGQVTSGYIELKGSLMTISLHSCRTDGLASHIILGCLADSRKCRLRFSLDTLRLNVNRDQEYSQRLHLPALSH